MEKLVKSIAMRMNQEHAGKNRSLDEIRKLRADGDKYGNKAKMAKAHVQYETHEHAMKSLEKIAQDMGIKQAVYNEMERAWQEDYTLEQRRGEAEITNLVSAKLEFRSRVNPRLRKEVV